MPVTMEGVTPSSEIRARLAAEGRPVVLAFSRGKDSVAAWIALRDAGCEVVPVHYDLVPGLRFVDESIAYFEDAFGARIRRYPHASFWRWLRNYTFQPPERCGVIDAADPYPWTPETLEDDIRLSLGLRDSWLVTGVRAVDSPQRWLGVRRHGPVHERARRAMAVWDWTKAEVMAAIEAAGVELPVDYRWWGRSFDGLDHRFVAPLAEHAPDDWARVLEWFPLAELELFRARMIEEGVPDA